jgi:hypothetical protein
MRPPARPGAEQSYSSEVAVQAPGALWPQQQCPRCARAAARWRSPQHADRSQQPRHGTPRPWRWRFVEVDLTLTPLREHELAQRSAASPSPHNQHPLARQRTARLRRARAPDPDPERLRRRGRAQAPGWVTRERRVAERGSIARNLVRATREASRASNRREHPANRHRKA